MAEPRHKMESKPSCAVRGCTDEAERSINAKAVEKVGLLISESAEKRVHLCKKHYKEFKKKTKKERELERLGW